MRKAWVLGAALAAVAAWVAFTHWGGGGTGALENAEDGASPLAPPAAESVDREPRPRAASPGTDAGRIVEVPGNQVRGVVLRREDSEPVGGTTVRWRRGTWTELEFDPSADAAPAPDATIQTGADGKFAFDVGADEMWRIVATTEGGRSGGETGEGPESSVEVVLALARPVVVRVVAADTGEPVASARVHV